MSEIFPEKLLGMYTTDTDSILIRCVGGPHDGREVTAPRSMLYNRLYLEDLPAWPVSFTEDIKDYARHAFRRVCYRPVLSEETSWHPSLTEDGRYLFKHEGSA